MPATRAPAQAELRRRAVELFGSKAAAREWLNSEAMALERRKPVDLLKSAEGRRVLSTLLTQLDFGVYI